MPGLASATCLGISFNQDASCFSVGTPAGFRVYNTEPFREQFRREIEGGITLVEMLFRCNIFCLVGASPKYPSTKAVIYDDHQGRAIGELSFRNAVLAVRLRKDRIAVALEHKVLVYNFADLRLLHAIETLSNPAGLMALSPSADSAVLACPGLHAGQVRVELYDTRRTKFVSAHNSTLAALALSSDGKQLATASVKGTLVRVFSTADGTKLRELRRGSDPAVVYSLAFSHGDTPSWVAVTSDKGTAHVFKLTGSQQHDSKHTATGSGPSSSSDSSKQQQQHASATGRSNPLSTLAMVGSYLPVGSSYFSSERSFAQLRLPDTSRMFVGFGKEPATLLVVSCSGSFFKARFDTKLGGSCEHQSFCL